MTASTEDQSGFERIAVDHATLEKIDTVGEAVAEIPEIGPILSLATGVIFTEDDDDATRKLRDALRTELNEYVDTAILESEVRRLKSQVSGFRGVLAEMIAFLDKGKDDDAVEELKGLERLMVDQEADFSDGVIDTEKALTFGAFARLRLDVLENLAWRDPSNIWKDQYPKVQDRYTSTARDAIDSAIERRQSKVSAIDDAEHHTTQTTYEYGSVGEDVVSWHTYTWTDSFSHASHTAKDRGEADRTRTAHIDAVGRRLRALLDAMVLSPLEQPMARTEPAEWEIWPSTWEDLQGRWEKRIRWPPFDPGSLIRARPGDRVTFLAGPLKSIHVSFGDGRWPFTEERHNVEIPNQSTGVNETDLGQSSPYNIGSETGRFTYTIRTLGEEPVQDDAVIYVDPTWTPWLSR